MAMRPFLIEILPNEHLSVRPVGTLQKDRTFVPVDQVLTHGVGYSMWIIFVLALVELRDVLRQVRLSSGGCASLPRQTVVIFGSSYLRAQMETLLLFRRGVVTQITIELRCSALGEQNTLKYK
jgi:hypothetical protein